MATDKFVLAPPPSEPRALELWLQHAAGLVLFEDVRGYALARLDPDEEASTREAATKAIDNAVYGLMMVIDGVTGTLRGGEYRVDLRMNVRLSRGSELIQQLDLFDGDGMCMGYHRWIRGDFGDDPVVRGDKAT
jgi:hypothetical protein